MATVFPQIAADGLPVVASPAPSRRAHLYFMENFRAIAILLVVLPHSYYLAWATSGTHWFGHHPLLSFLTGSTALFVFVSGFFFHYVGHADLPLPAFLAKKARALLPPYLVISVLLILTEAATSPDPSYTYPGDTLSGEFVYEIATGRAGPAMWYIPFIFLLFLCTPLFARFAKARMPTQAGVLVALALLGIVLNRSYADRLHDAGYFAFYYALGIACSAHCARFMALLRRPETPVLAGVGMVVLATAQYRLGLHEAAVGASGFWWQAWDFAYLRKLLQILFFASLTLRFADRRVPGIRLLAEWSFGVFFVHQIVLLLLQPLANRGWLDLPSPYVEIFAWGAVVLAMSLAMLWAAKRALGRWSRYVVGA